MHVLSLTELTCLFNFVLHDYIERISGRSTSIYSSHFGEHYKGGYISIHHRLELLDKLVLPRLNYGCEVCGFHTLTNI